MIIVGGGPGAYVRTKLLRQIVTAVPDGAMAVHMAEKYMGKCKVNSAFMHRKLREIIKVIRVHSQDEIEIEWNFDDVFSEQR